MDTLEIELNTDLGLLSFSPAFSETYKHINGIGKIPAGTQNNASVDLSASTWKIAADCLLQRNDKIDEGLRKILPLHHEFYETKGEPYVLYDSYFSENNDYRAGDASDSWNSAVGSTLLYVLNKYVYGLYPEFGGLMIKPCLPNSWKDCSISKIFRGCRYNIHFIQKDAGNCNTIESIYVNGTEINPNLPIRPQPEKTLNIEVILRS